MQNYPLGIYLDHNASCPVRAEVSLALSEAITRFHANPSSVHAPGREAKMAMILARDEIAAYFLVQPEEIIFTSGGTEGINLAIQGGLAGKSPGRIISSKCEHAAVLENLKRLELLGWKIDFLPCGLDGAPTAQMVKEAILDETRMVVLMAANNETGVKCDLAGIAALCEERRIPFVSDGVALTGKEAVLLPKGVTSFVFSGQKMGAPKGIGGIVQRRGHKLSPLLWGGAQERGVRAGTENLPGIIALAKAFSLCRHETDARGVLRDAFERELLGALDVSVNGRGPRVCNTSNLCFHGVDGETLLFLLDEKGVFASHGSACQSGALEPSHVLLAMGLSRKEAGSSLRFSLGVTTTESEMREAVRVIIDCVSGM